MQSIHTHNAASPQEATCVAQDPTTTIEQLTKQVALLKWNEEEHHAIERRLADVFYFLKAVLGEDINGSDYTASLDVNARHGLDYILNQMACLLLDASCNQFYSHNFYGSRLKGPNLD